MTTRSFRSYSVGNEAVTCLLPEVNGAELLEYHAMKRLDVVASRQEIYASDLWQTLKTLCEDEDHPLESLTVLISDFSEDEDMDDKMKEDYFLSNLKWRLQHCGKRKWRPLTVRAIRLPDPSETLFGNAFVHFCSTPSAGATREIRFSSTVLVDLNEEDQSRILKCLSNLKDVTSIVLEARPSSYAHIPDILEALAASPAASNLRTFSLVPNTNPLSYVHAAAVLRGVLQRAAVSLQKLLEACGPSLVALQLNQQCWRLSNLQPVAAGLESCASSLELVDMANSTFEPDCAWLLHSFLQRTKTLKHASFSRLRSSNQDTVLSLIMGLQRNTSLESLDLADLQVQNYHWNYVGLSIRQLLLSHWRLQSLQLTENRDIGQGNIEKIAEGAAGSGVLEEIYLDHCGIGDDEAAMVVGALCSTLGRNSFGRSTSSLRTLHLAGNFVGTQAAGAIATFLADPCCVLQKLVLSDCGIDDETLRALLPGLTQSRTVSSLNLSRNGEVTTQVWHDMAMAIPQLSKLRELEITCDTPQIANVYEARVLYPSFAQIKALYGAFLKGLSKNRTIVDSSISFGINDESFKAQESFLAHRNRVLPHIPQISSSTHDRGGGTGMWSHILSKLLGKSWAPHDGTSLAFHLMTTHPEAVFSRHNLTASPPKKRQKRSLSMRDLSRSLPSTY
ncbi:NACHT, LRR and PYD domains-containing protein [Seminavis robusta]|uniref:NACHT, LRR and PYD domains-containing protein n=1 Tax=Seminavis robusta TaxID=568900 RepID=A0A9N8D7S8_9STRA|nr:NACHT, LRR and PYD domains-containing protein [Seminavis robusta]|eukprot:Sro9_g007420.1 NACHT, LRR and PYD domains-containing protein (675) ;mRNA; r:141358-143382